MEIECIEIQTYPVRQVSTHGYYKTKISYVQELAFPHRDIDTHTEALNVPIPIGVSKRE